MNQKAVDAINEGENKYRQTVLGQQPLPGHPTIEAKAVSEPSGVCSRCHHPIKEFRPPDGDMTAGYYVAAAWLKYANVGEIFICDDCMWRDARYIADYGKQPPSPGVSREQEP